MTEVERAWPVTPELLVDTSRCPWCFTAITASPCATCGLDLSDPRTFDVLSLSQRIAGLVRARDQALGQIRADQASVAGEAAPGEAPWPAPAPSSEGVEPAGESDEATPRPAQNAPGGAVPGGMAAPVAARPAGAAPSPAAVPPVAVPPAAAPPAAAGPSPGPGRPDDPVKPRRSGVQVFLLSVGVVLLAVAAAFFLTVAWVSGGLVLRSIIVGASTAGVIVTASLLRRRRLTATAEGIALLGIALVALDVWAVRANDLAGAADIEPVTYGGWAAILAGAGFVAWARFAGLRAPLSAGVASLAIGPPLVAAGFFPDDTILAVYAAGLTVLAVTLPSPLVRRLARADIASVAVETTVLRVAAGVGAALALFASLAIDPWDAWVPLAASVPLALLLAAHAAVLARAGAGRFAPIASPFAVLALGAGVAAAVTRLADATVAVTVPVLVAVVIALALEAVAARLPAGIARMTLVVAAAAAAVGAAFAVLVPVLYVLTAFAEPVARLLPVFTASALRVNDVDATSTAAALTLIAVVVLAAVVWRLAGRAAHRRPALLWAGAIVALLIGPQLRVVVAIVLWYVAVGIVGAVLLRRRRGHVVVSAVVGGLALAVGWFLSFSSPLAWTLATLGVLVALWLVASVTRATRVPAVVVLVVFAAGSGWFAPAAVLRGLGIEVPGLGPLEAVGAVAGICLLGALVPPFGPFAPRWLDAVQREAAACAAVTIVFLSSLLPAVAGAGERTGGAWWAAVDTVTALAAAMIALSGTHRTWSVLRPVAAVLWPVLAAMAILAIVRTSTTPPLLPSIAVGSTGLVAAALALALLRREPRVRVLADAGSALVVVWSVTALAPRAGMWIALLLVAITVLIWAVDADGLFAARGPRRHLVWLAILAGTGALWWRLFDERVEAVEFYTLPPAAVLLLVAAASERARRLVTERSAVPPAVIAFAGASLALVPTALADAGDTVRVVAAVVASTVLLVAGAWVRSPRTPDLLPVALAAAGAGGLLAASTSRVALVAERGHTDGFVSDLLVLVTVAALVAAAVGCSRRTTAWARPVGRGTAIAAALVLVVGETVLVAVDGGPLLRAVLVLVLLGASGTLVVRTAHVVTGAPLAGVLLGGATLVAGTGVAVGIRPIEWLTLPLAAGLLAAAAAARARPLSPLAVGLATLGLAVALLPSAALVSDDVPRAVAVLLATIAVLVSSSLVSREALRPLTLPAFSVAAVALVVAGGLRSVVDLEHPLFDVWVAVVAVFLVGAGALLQRRRDGVSRVAPSVAVVAALGFVVILSAVRLAAVGDESIRASLTIVVVLAIGLLWRGAHSTLVFWVSVGLGAALGAVGFVTASADPVEVVTAPIALALVLRGIRSLRLDLALRSWPALGAGVALLLLPSLVFDFADDNVLWRVIALGIVALAVLLAGARFKLQAPVLLGGVVLLVHAVAQLWPWIASIYESVSGLGWLWLGIAGVLLIVVAATYERRIREVKAVALAIRALR